MAVKRIIDLVEDNSPTLDDYVAVDNSSPNSTRRTRLSDLLSSVGEDVYATAAQGDLADTALQPSDIGTTPGTVAAGDDVRIVNAPRSVATVTAARALAGVLPKTIVIDGADGGIFELDASDTTSAEDGGSYCGTIIRPSNYATDGVYKRFVESTLDDSAFGVSPANADNLALLHAAEAAAIRLGVTLAITADAPLDISDSFVCESNLSINWLSNEAYFRLTAASTTGAVFTTLDPSDVDVVNITVINPRIDGNSIAGQNGIGIGGAGGTENINIVGGHIKNCVRSTTIGGGRAVTFQLGMSNCSALDYVAENCTTGGDIHGWEDVANSQATQIRMRYHVENCEEGFSAYDLQALGSDDPDFINCDVEFTAHNCGLSVVGASVGTEGGAIIFERSSFANIRATIINDSTYGTIGAVVRGKGYHNRVHFTFVGDAVRLVDGNNSTSLEPVAPNTNTPFNDNVITFDHVFGSVTNVVGGDTAAKFLRNHLTGLTATVTGNLIAAPVDDSTTSSLDVTQRSTGKRQLGLNTEFKGNYPTFDATFNYALPNLSRIGNIGLNVTGGVFRISTLTAQDFMLSRNFVEIARLGSDGLHQLLQATANPSKNGDFVIQRTSNTSLTLKLQGTDGVVRSVSLTLA